MSWDEDVRDLRMAGGSDADVIQLQNKQTDDLVRAGAGPQEIDEYFGRRRGRASPEVLAQIRENAASLSTATADKSSGSKPPRLADGVLDSIEAGWQLSVAGLVKRGELPDISLPEHAGFISRMAASGGQLAGDFISGSMFFGGLGGATAGAAAGTAAGATLAPEAGPLGIGVTAALGGLLGGGAGAFALPAFLRKELMDHYARGEAGNFSDFLANAGPAMLEAAKRGVVGAGTAGTGAAVGGLLTGVPGLVRGAAQSAAEATALVGINGAMEGKVPTAQDFADAALMVGAMHLTGAAVKKFNAAPTIESKLRDLYALTGRTPSWAVVEAQENPAFKTALHEQGNNVVEIARVLGSDDPETPWTPGLKAFRENARKEAEAEAQRQAEENPVFKTALHEQGNNVVDIAKVLGSDDPETPWTPEQRLKFRLEQSARFDEQRAAQRKADAADEERVRLQKAHDTAEQLNERDRGIADQNRTEEAARVEQERQASERARQRYEETDAAFRASQKAEDAAKLEEARQADERARLRYEEADSAFRENARKEAEAEAQRQKESKARADALYEANRESFQREMDGAPDTASPAFTPRPDEVEAQRQQDIAFTEKRLAELPTDGSQEFIRTTLEEELSSLRQQSGMRSLDAMGEREPARDLKAQTENARALARAQQLKGGVRHAGEEDLMQSQKEDPAEVVARKQRYQDHLKALGEAEAALHQGEREDPRDVLQRLHDIRELQRELGEAEASLLQGERDDPEVLKSEAAELQAHLKALGDAEANLLEGERSRPEDLKAEQAAYQKLLNWHFEDEAAARAGDRLAAARDTRETVDAWKADPAATKAHIDAGINRDGTTPDTRTWAKSFQDAWRSLRRNVWDSAQPLLDLTRDIVGKSWWELKAAGATAYSRFANMAGLAQMVEDVIENGPRDWNTKKRLEGAKGLKTILRSVPDASVLMDYAVASRVVEKSNQGISTGFDRYAAQAFVELHREVYEPAFRDLVQFREGVTQYLIDSGVIPKVQAAIFRQANKDFVPFYRVMEQSAGAAPYGRSASGNPIKVMEGSTRQVIDPAESLIKDTYLFHRLAELNGVKAELVKLAEANPNREANILEKVTPDGMSIEDRLSQAADRKQIDRILDQAKGEGDTFGGLSSKNLVAFGQPNLKADEFTFYRNGVPEIWRTRGDVAALLNGTDKEQLGTIARLLSVPAKVERAGILNTPAFILRHAIRNPIMAMFYTQNKMMPWDLVGGLQSYLSKDFNFQDMLAGGTGNAIAQSLDREYLQKNVFELSKETGLLDLAHNSIRSPMQAMQSIAKIIHSAAAVSDAVIRTTEFKLAREAGKDLRTASFEARRVIPDAARGGAAMRAITSAVPFFHMEWQGMEMLANAALTNPARFAAAAAGIAGVSALVWALGRGDSRVEDAPREQRDLFWLIPHDDWREVDQADERALLLALSRPEDQRREANGKLYTNEGAVFRIPKPFQAGIIFGSGTERALDAAVSQRPDAFRGFGASLLGATLRMPIPAWAKPIVEQFANRSTFTGSPIVPESVMHELPEYRYTDATSEPGKLLARAIAAVPYIGRSLAVSPMIIDNWIRSYTGDVGQFVLDTVSRGLNPNKVPRVPGHELIAGLEDTSPFVRAFVVRHPTANAASIQDFHDAAERFQQVKATLLERTNRGDSDAADRLRAIQSQEFGGVNLSRATAMMRGYAHAIRMATENDKLTPQEKRQTIDGLYYKMAATAKTANAQLHEAQDIAEGRRAP